jgi:hypothetical protein
LVPLAIWQSACSSNNKNKIKHQKPSPKNRPCVRHTATTPRPKNPNGPSLDPQQLFCQKTRSRSSLWHPTTDDGYRSSGSIKIVGARVCRLRHQFPFLKPLKKTTQKLENNFFFSSPSIKTN